MKNVLALIGLYVVCKTIHEAYRDHWQKPLADRIADQLSRTSV